MPIKPNSERTKEQLRENGRKGGLKRAENARKRKQQLYTDYHDLSLLRSELWALALEVRRISEILPPYDDKTAVLKRNIKLYIEDIEKRIEKDRERLYP